MNLSPSVNPSDPPPAMWEERLSKAPLTSILRLFSLSPSLVKEKYHTHAHMHTLSFSAWAFPHSCCLWVLCYDFCRRQHLEKNSCSRVDRPGSSCSSVQLPCMDPGK